MIDRGDKLDAYPFQPQKEEPKESPTRYPKRLKKTAEAQRIHQRRVELMED